MLKLMTVRTVMVFALSLVALNFLQIQYANATKSSASVHAGPSPCSKYSDYVKTYHKDGENSKSMRWLLKAKLFLARTLKIFKHNVQYLDNNGHSYYLQENRYTDLTFEEITKSYVQNGLDLIPVEEAEKMPDLPADDVVLHAKTLLEKREPPPKLRDSRGSSLDFFTALEPDQGIKDLFNNRPELARSNSIVKRRLVADKNSLIAQESPRGSGELNELRVNLPIREVASERLSSPRRNVARAIKEREKLRGSREILESFYANYLRDAMGDFTDDFYSAHPYASPDFGTDGAALSGEDSPRWSLVKSCKEIYATIKNDVEEGYLYDLIPEKDRKKKVPDSKVTNDDKKKTGVLYDIDWRQTNCLSPIKTQGECNSCYAFASLDLMEFLYCRQRNQTVEFSTQYVVDCGSKFRLSGCKGGRIVGVGAFIMSFGLQEAASYPYKSAEQACPLDSDRAKPTIEKSALRPKVKGWRLYSEMSAWYKWLPRSPLIVGINMPSDFFGYGGAIHDGLNCVKNMTHAMLLVGAGSEDGLEFWLLKNSFSSEWGENGYFRLSKRAPLRCFNSAVVVRANFTEAATVENSLPLN